MNRVDTDIEEALKMIDTPFSDQCSFSAYTTPFLFGTESQEGVNSVIDYNNKDVLTVASSGDQYLGAVYYGASIVDLYDVNRFSYYITCLKVAAIKVLSYGDFLSFFIPMDKNKESIKFWNYRTFKKLIPELPSDVALFWDKVIYFAKKKKYGNFILLDMTINDKDIVMRGMPFYSDEVEYYNLQVILKNRNYPSFYESDVKLLSDVLVDDYDVVYLSNIVECLVMEVLQDIPYFMASYGIEDRVEYEVLERIGAPVMKLLRQNGVALMDYRANSSCEMASDLLFSNNYFDVTEVPAKIISSKSSKPYPEDTDLVLTYKPSKTGNYLKNK